MDPTQHNDLLQYLTDGTFPVDIQDEPKYAKTNFRRKALHFCAEGEILYKVSTSASNKSTYVHIIL